MKIKHIFLFFISLLFGSFTIWAQEIEPAPADTVSKVTNYGLRIGVDLAKPVRSLLEDGYTGFEVIGDFRISKRFYIAAEIGSEKNETNETYHKSSTNGGYLKIGTDYNTYNNWIGLNNAIYGGLRYGISTFSHELLSYQVYTTDQTFPPATVNTPIEFTGLKAHWVELIFGIKTEVFTNLYLSINLQLKRLIVDDKPDNFNNLYIPGFNRTYDFSKFGVGYSYSISYLIPIFKK